MIFVFIFQRVSSDTDGLTRSHSLVASAKDFAPDSRVSKTSDFLNRRQCPETKCKSKTPRSRNFVGYVA
jgi:hypothetical protein